MLSSMPAETALRLSSPENIIMSPPASCLAVTICRPKAGSSGRDLVVKGFQALLFPTLSVNQLSDLTCTHGSELGQGWGYR